MFAKLDLIIPLQVFIWCSSIFKVLNVNGRQTVCIPDVSVNPTTTKYYYYYY